MNNEVHESVGGQATAAKNIDLYSLISAMGHSNMFKVENHDQLKTNIINFMQCVGPSFLEVKIRPGSRENLGRPTIRPIRNKENLYNPEMLHPYTRKIVHSLNKNNFTENSGLDIIYKHEGQLKNCPFSSPGLCDIFTKYQDDPNYEFTNKCSTDLPEQVINYNGENSGWIRCWYKKQ